MSGEPLFLSLVLKDDVFTGKYMGTIDQLGNAILTIVKMRVNEQEIYDNMIHKSDRDNHVNFIILENSMNNMIPIGSRIFESFIGQK